MLVVASAPRGVQGNGQYDMVLLTKVSYPAFLAADWCIKVAPLSWRLVSMVLMMPTGLAAERHCFVRLRPQRFHWSIPLMLLYDVHLWQWADLECDPTLRVTLQANASPESWLTHLASRGRRSHPCIRRQATGHRHCRGQRSR